MIRQRSHDPRARPAELSGRRRAVDVTPLMDSIFPAKKLENRLRFQRLTTNYAAADAPSALARYAGPGPD
ncbi:hypothetical protein EVAR_18821_1 [Eumeta japonica]|uniref:Uncharacterized protein n=1 Tax=Eumeta variegata TaxID=151549 RepID=A0A4C1UMM5_EUMVA|nr:hypothetical protein EVAR_18821_1 [Eumeta japonica]